MIPATRRSRARPFQKCSSSSSSSSSRGRSRGMGPLAKDGNPYKPHAGGPSHVDRGDGVAHRIGDVVHRDRREVPFEIVQSIEPRTELARGDPFVDVPVDHERRSPPQEDRLEGLRAELGSPLFLLAAPLSPNTAPPGAVPRARIARTTASNASRSFRSVVSPASRNRSTGPSRLRSAVTAGRFSYPWTSPTAAMRTAAPNVGPVDEPFPPSEFADDRDAGGEVDDRETRGPRLDGPALLGRCLGLPRRRIHEDDPAILVHARRVHVARREDVRDLLDD